MRSIEIFGDSYEIHHLADFDQGGSIGVFYTRDLHSAHSNRSAETSPSSYRGAATVSFSLNSEMQFIAGASYQAPSPQLPRALGGLASRLGVVYQGGASVNLATGERSGGNFVGVGAPYGATSMIALAPLLSAVRNAKTGEVVLSAGWGTRGVNEFGFVVSLTREPTLTQAGYNLMNYDEFSTAAPVHEKRIVEQFYNPETGQITAILEDTSTGLQTQVGISAIQDNEPSVVSIHNIGVDNRGYIGTGNDWENDLIDPRTIASGTVRQDRSDATEFEFALAESAREQAEERRQRELAERAQEAIAEHDLSGEMEKPEDSSDETTGPRPVVLDLDGNGISITELSQSQHYVDGGDGLLHRTAWAAPGDVVLFFDVSGDGRIKEKREYVFTEWDPTSASDCDALRAA